MKSNISLILVLSALLVIVSCSSENKSESDAPDTTNVINQVTDSAYVVQLLADTTQVFTLDGYYDNWETAQFDNLKIVYPKGHLHADKMQDNAQLYKTVLRRNSQIFRLPEPTDPIVLFYYTGFGQGQELANSEFPTARGDSIYYWSGNKFGITAGIHTLNRWTKVITRHKMLYQGIIRLLDASGRNYHAMTLDLIDSSKYMPLDSLAVNERINFNAEATKTAQAASFIDYFIYKYGIDNFKLLYESQQPFDSTIQAICNMDIKSLEKEWLQVVRETVQKK